MMRNRPAKTRGVSRDFALLPDTMPILSRRDTIRKSGMNTGVAA